jgi:hypothetical protein
MSLKMQSGFAGCVPMCKAIFTFLLVRSASAEKLTDMHIGIPSGEFNISLIYIQVCLIG